MSSISISSILSTEHMNYAKDFSFVSLKENDMEANDYVTSVLIWQAENHTTHYSLNQPYCLLHDNDEGSACRKNQCDIRKEWSNATEKQTCLTNLTPMCSLKVFTVGLIVPSSQESKDHEEKKTKGTKLQLLGLSFPEQFDSFYHTMLYPNLQNFFTLGLNSALIDLVSIQHCEATSSFFLHSRTLKNILLQMVSCIQNTLRISCVTKSKGKLTFLSPSLQRQWMSNNTHLLYKNVLSTKSFHEETQYPILRRLFGCCIFMSLDETTQRIIDALSESANELEMSFSSASDIMDLRDVTFLNLLEQDAIDNYVATIEKNRKMLPSDISYAVLFSVYCDTCRDYFPLPRSQLSKFSFLQIHCQGAIPHQTVVLDNLLMLLQQPWYSTKGFLRPTHLFSCILEDLLGGISKAIVLSSLFSGCREKLIEIATSFAKITLSPSIMPASTMGAMAQSLLNWEQFISFVIQNSSSPCVNKIVDAAISQILGSQLTSEQLIRCIRDSNSSEVAVLRCREFLLRSYRAVSSTQSAGKPSTTNMNASLKTKNLTTPSDSFYSNVDRKKEEPFQAPIRKTFHIVSTLRISKDPSNNTTEIPFNQTPVSRNTLITSSITKPITQYAPEAVKSFSRDASSPLPLNMFESPILKAATPLSCKISISLPVNKTTLSLVNQETTESLNSASSLVIENVSPTPLAITPPKVKGEKRIWSRCSSLPTVFPDRSNPATDVMKRFFQNYRVNEIHSFKCNDVNKEKSSLFHDLESASSLCKTTADRKFLSEAFIRSSFLKNFSATNESFKKTQPVKEVSCNAQRCARRILRDPLLPNVKSPSFPPSSTVSPATHWFPTEHIVRRYHTLNGKIRGPLRLENQEQLQDPSPHPLTSRQLNKHVKDKPDSI